MEQLYEAEPVQLLLFPEIGYEGRWLDLPFAFTNLDEAVWPFLVRYGLRLEELERSVPRYLLKRGGEDV